MRRIGLPIESRNSWGVVIDDREGQKRAIDYADMAILLRSVRGSGKVFSETLQSRGIPGVVKGVGGLFDHDEVQLVHAAFCLLARSDMLIDEEGRHHSNGRSRDKGFHSTEDPAP